jgi:retron-type reverse transcriptase
MTPGITAETVDGLSMEKMATSIEAIRQEKWRWTPPRRVLTDTPNGGKRPLDRPIWSDKVGQAIRRSSLEASDEPQCSPHRHGFRPQRGGPTALHEGGETWTGTTGCIEGDLKGCFSNIAHTILRQLLRANRHDHRFWRRIEGALKAGYGEAWTSPPSLSGSPQGGIGSPILSTISMERCAKFVQDTLIPE